MSGASPNPDPERIEKTVALARTLQERATALQTPPERRQQAELDRMLQNPADKVTLIQLTDEAFRCQTPARTAEHLIHILDVQGVPRFFSRLDRALLRGFQTFGGWLPGVSVPLVKEHMQQETANVVLPAETDLLASHLAARRQEGVRMNLNFLGEALLGETEAAHRLERYRQALQLPEVEVLSVKISTLYSQISALARRQTVDTLCQRLEPLYREAARLRFVRPDGTSVPKFVYLDMEEYRDLQLTAEAFMRTLDRPGLEQVAAGIALQAYIPDSIRVQRQLQAWARRRAGGGGAPITIRIVKGANMEMERVEASLRDCPQAVFLSKAETDASYKRMLHEALLPENRAAVRVGVASHNLFDLAYGLVVAQELGMPDRIQFEMLEGMANHQRRALRELTASLLLYAPACRQDEFLHAIGYLLRRLDENTGPENFLRHAFKLKVGSPEWHHLEASFRSSFHLPVSDAPRRSQNRQTEQHGEARAESPWMDFVNEPDTDWSLPANSAWAESIVAQPTTEELQIPLVIAGEEITPTAARMAVCRDPSRPGVTVGQFRLAGEAEVDAAIAAAHADAERWRQRSYLERNALLGRVAQELRRSRATLIGAAVANGGKTVAEADPEVSEAVDFVEFYRAAARSFFNLPGLTAEGRGVVAVVAPWNFPIAIPCGGIAAALAAGNTVLFKPASDAVLVAWELCGCFWRAGISRQVLQFVPCSGEGPGTRLVTDARVDTVILTGGTSTALRLLQAKPTLRLFAETGGKNATIVTALSDRELAIKHILHSAFSHSGQKCSATSLLLLEAEIYDDLDFKRMLGDAVQSLPVGSAWDLATRVGPLIRPPAGELEIGLKTLEPGESWAVVPKPVGPNPNLWSPGVKYGVQPGSRTHLTEFFGPLLGVMRFERLAEAIALVNETGYGLTSGLHSLDDREQAEWEKGIQAGNLYLNRGTTGAVVLRQPFGGMGRSCFGPGLKAGGPNYVAQFMRFSPVQRPAALPSRPLRHPQLEALRRALEAGPSPALRPGTEDWRRLFLALGSFDEAWAEEFSRPHDHQRLLGQDNFRRYLPFREIRVRATAEDTIFDLVARVAAARVTGARVIVSSPAGGPSPEVALLDQATETWAGGIEFVAQSDDELVARLRSAPAHAHAHERLRYAAPGRVPERVRLAAATAGVYLADEPVLAEGRVELLWYLREQSVCRDYHRYGNLGARAGESRRETT